MNQEDMERGRMPQSNLESCHSSLVSPYVCQLLFGDPDENRLHEIDQNPRSSRFGSVMIPVTDQRESIMNFTAKSPNPRRLSTFSSA